MAIQGIGGGGAWQHVIDRTAEQGIPRIGDPKRSTVELFADYTGKEVTALVRSEAAGATATALLLGAEMGIPTLDGGITGRAVPEVQQSIPWINGIASVPTAIITPWGDQIIIKHAIDEYRVEDISRAIAVASGGEAIITMTPMSGAQLERGILDGNLSEAERYGRTVREARDAGKDPIAALVQVANGYKLFEGVVTKSDERGDRGFNWVEAEFEGVNEYAGQSYKVFVKNENIVAWLDGEIDAVSPDYIYNLNPETGESTIGVGIGVGVWALDYNKAGNGYYTIKERRFAYIMFQLGFLELWVTLIILGTFLRGPNWNFFGPYEIWDTHKVEALNSVDLSQYFWIEGLGRALPKPPEGAGLGTQLGYILYRESPGIILTLAYFIVVPPLMAITVFRSFFVRMGFIRYMVMSNLLLFMALLPIKMILRWTLDLKYIISIPEYFLNL